MNHEQAIDIHAAEGYLLGDLSPAERDAFEEHYFDCDACFADVRDGATVASGVRTVAKEREARHGHASFFPAFAAAAGVAVAVLGTAVYQQVAVIAPLRAQIAKERQPRIVNRYFLRDVRGPQDMIVDGRAPFTLEFDIAPEPPSPRYTCTIVDPSGKPKFSVAVTAAQAREAVQLQVPGGLLTPGEYQLTVTGTGGVPINQMGFRVQ